MVDLRVLTREDVLHGPWYGWFNDEEICKTLQKHYFPNTVESQLKFWESNIQDAKDKLQLGICKTGNDNLLGIVSLNAIDYINRKCEFSIVIGEKEGRNISIFLESARLIFKHAFKTLNMNKIYGGSLSKELVTLMCRSLGCKEEGISRMDIFKNGSYHDSYRYSILSDEFILSE
ncbi:MAG TPA: GNAT family protein [Oligoflexia bacterium]|nr:GNAT family protein [Oligoflexia bacterium]HMP48512.1 GNAT family protein [Oligoflexia bacterium]